MFRDNLKRIRKENELTQEQLGKMVGVTGAYIQQLEKGIKNNPSLELILKLCEALHTAPWVIAENDKEMSESLSAYIASDEYDYTVNNLDKINETVNLQIDHLQAFIETVAIEFKEIPESEIKKFSALVAVWIRGYMELTVRAKIQELLNEYFDSDSHKKK